MEPQEYSTLFVMEDRYWWYKGLHHLILKLLAQHNINQHTRLLDAGCGTGGILAAINKKYHLQGCGIEISSLAIDYCRKRGLTQLLRASVENMPLKSERFDVIISLDVIYHQAVRDDVWVLKECHRLLAPNGILILNLPAYDWLKSSHDVAIHTARRYTCTSLRRKLLSAGFQRMHLSYRNTFLFPIFVTLRLLRKFRKQGGPVSSDLSLLPPWMDWILTNILYLENYILRFLRLPYGLSVVGIALKEENTNADGDQP